MKNCFCLLGILILTSCGQKDGPGSGQNNNLQNGNTCLTCAKGNERGKASDLRPEDFEAAWFTGNKTIRYCYTIGAGFPISSNTVQTEITSAFKKWKDYSIFKKVNETKREIKDAAYDREVKNYN